MGPRSPAPPRQPARLATAERKSVWEPRMGSPHLFLGEKVRTQSSCLETSENLRKNPRTVETFENLRLWIRTLKTVESPAGRVSECYKHFGPLTKSIYKSCILINPISQSVQFSCSLLRAQVNHSACRPLFQWPGPLFSGPGEGGPLFSGPTTFSVALDHFSVAQGRGNHFFSGKIHIYIYI